MTEIIRNQPRGAGRRLEVERWGRTRLVDGTWGEHYVVGECNVIQTDKTHISISHETRDPTWEEIAAARYALLPKLRDCVMVLPPDDQYVNAHDHCFHVHMLRTLAPGGQFHNAEAW